MSTRDPLANPPECLFCRVNAAFFDLLLAERKYFEKCQRLLRFLVARNVLEHRFRLTANGDNHSLVPSFDVANDLGARDFR